jgi:hypothetical protein
MMFDSSIIIQSPAKQSAADILSAGTAKRTAPALPTATRQHIFAMRPVQYGR